MWHGVTTNVSIYKSFVSKFIHHHIIPVTASSWDPRNRIHRTCHNNFNSAHQQNSLKLLILYWQLRNCWLKFILFRKWSIYSNYLVVKRFVCTPFTYKFWWVVLSFCIRATTRVCGTNKQIYLAALVNNHIIDINKRGMENLFTFAYIGTILTFDYENRTYGSSK